MRLSLYPNQRLHWELLEQDCRSAEEDGWDGVWMCDHLVRPGDEPPGYFLECWTSIAAMAARVPRITMGSLVSGTSLRHPSLLAITAATVQEISGGRLVLGIGAGGDAAEHEALGLPFLSDVERIQALAEACAVLRELLSPGAAVLDGVHYRLRLRGTGVSSSLQVPLLVGAAGPRGIDVAARYADMWAVWGSPSELEAGGRFLDERCRQHDRDPARVSRAAIVMLTTDDETRRWPATLPADSREVHGALSHYRDVGVDELIICDYALPRPVRSAVLQQLRCDVAAWTDTLGST